MPTPDILPATEREAIEAAVRDAERRVGCEIVVTVVRACDDYQHAAWKAATCGALAGALVSAAATRGLEVWGFAWAWLLLPAPLGTLLGWWLAQAPVVRRALATPEARARRVAARAAVAFLDARVFRTRAHTGVLLFLAGFERQVVVLADDGVCERVSAAELAAIARTVTARLRHRGPAAGATAVGAALLEGVERCAAVLAEHGFPAALEPRGVGARPNELADAVRLEE
jgi:uncharacterized membrane protein